ncbi:MAG: neutral/alkaline non-lysosomal ceramidase N-terminal domain-containing protein [Planctomycetaceae bacterium]|nr:neutral/alkaline non-lysosomal ceramidase N-terminal domain-containing protein [Planctomycetaceae bacterium]
MFRLCLVLLAVSIPALFPVADAAEKTLRAGAATSNITPPIGGAIIGGFLPAPSKHIHDELHARCLVLDDGERRVAFVVCDLLGVHRLVSNEARRQITEKLGIPLDNVLISGTHTHSATSALGQDRLRYEQELDDYQKFVIQRIVDGVQRAVNTLRPAEFAYGEVDVPEHVFNRRWYLRPGTMPENPFGGLDLVKMNPGAGNPNLVEPAGPVDPTVSFFMLREPDGKSIGLFSAYSLHYVGDVGPAHISADYFGIYSERMKHLLGATEQDPPFVAMMANGTSGDINNINFKQPRPRKETYGQMRYVAHDVAEKVHKQIASLKFRSDITIDARYREPSIAWRRPTSEQLAWAKQKSTEEAEVNGRANLPKIYADRALRLAEYPELATVPVQVFRLGEMSMSSMPCEIFCEIGIDYRRRTPLKPGFMVSLNHGYFGYLPTPRQHDLGGYETWLGTNRLERTASDKLLDELLKMTSEMKQ